MPGDPFPGTYLCRMKHGSIKYHDRFILIVWAILWLNFFVQYTLFASFSEALFASSCIVLISYPLTTYLSTTLLRKAMARRRMLPFVFRFVLISLAITILLIASSRLLIYWENHGVFGGSQLFSGRDSIPPTFLDTFLLALLVNFGFCGMRFFEENMKLQKELAETQMQILRGQINPHFMFNVLNHIHVLMQSNVELASALLLQYAEILRYQLYNGSAEQVSLEQEVDFLKNYVEVEKLRWRNKIVVRTNWQIEDHTKKIPPLLMVTFVENAFKHVSRSSNEKGSIVIVLKQTGSMLELAVENSISPSAAPGDKKRQGTGIGLANVRKRLDILYPEKYDLSIDKSEHLYKSVLILKLR